MGGKTPHKKGINHGAREAGQESAEAESPSSSQDRCSRGEHLPFSTSSHAGLRLAGDCSPACPPVPAIRASAELGGQVFPAPGSYRNFPASTHLGPGPDSTQEALALLLALGVQKGRVGSVNPTQAPAAAQGGGVPKTAHGARCLQEKVPRPLC